MITATADQRVERCVRCLTFIVLLTTAACSAETGEAPFSVIEATIPEMQRAMDEGRVTARALVEQYLIRIALYEETLNAVITVNPRALEIADSLDRERAEGRERGPLHGIPIALKDNIHTHDLPTTAGALAFEGFVPPYDATLTRHLRDAGAIILAKTVMTELANFMAQGMPQSYSAVGGFGRNPYDPRADPGANSLDRRALSPSGSSSGAGTAASFWAANVGTETAGSILGPADATMLVGIRPTVGRISRWGVIPITADQDTPGPMARTVIDAAILLGVLEGPTIDPNDPATGVCEPPPGGDYTSYLRADGLRGARIGVPRAFYVDPVRVPGRAAEFGGLPPERRQALEEVIALLRAQGADVIDSVDIPSIVDPDSANNLFASGAFNSVARYGMKRDFNAWLATLGDRAPVHSLTELRAWNLAHERVGSLRYGQAQLDRVDALSLEGSDRDRYELSRANDIRLAAAHGIDEVMATHHLDALLFGGSFGVNLSSAGYPSVAVPFTRIPIPADSTSPTGFQPAPAPYGVSFSAGACAEPKLLEIAYSFEQATRGRVPPPAFP